MHRADRLLTLAPPGLIVEHVEAGLNGLIIVARSSSKMSVCPVCGYRSKRVHSRYHRALADLPSHGQAVRIKIVARRFRCGKPAWRRRIFTERFDPKIALSSARRTTRLERIVHHLGLALGGRPAAGLARRLMLPVSKDTLLRVVRRHAFRYPAQLKVIGIDDWAWKRGHRYGTVICDLEHRRIVDLLPDREMATVAAWLSARPAIEIIARDRGGGYGPAAARALPDAMQVADRWHLFENASAAFLEAIRRSMRSIRVALGATAIDPAMLTSAERLQYEGFLRRDQATAAIRGLVDQGITIKEIVRRTGYSRKIVRTVVRGGGTEMFRGRMSSLEPFLPQLDAEWTAGCRNGAELWRRLQGIGFNGGLRVVTEWTTRRRRSEGVPAMRLRKPPSARAIARLMTIARDHLSKADAIMVTKIEAAVPALVAARRLIDRFHGMIRSRNDHALDGWIKDAAGSLISSFAAGISADRNAVTAAIAKPWSNGQTEGQITKLKLVKRQMYGRAKIDLLRARLLGPARDDQPLHQK